MRSVNPDTLARGIRRGLVEASVVVLLFAGGLTVGLHQLARVRHRDGRGVDSLSDMFGSAVMMAAGRGRFNPQVWAVPGLEDFLHHRTGSFSPASIPAEVPVNPKSLDDYHRYLIYTVAQVWRVSGIRWTALEPMMAVFLGLTAVLAYGLFRLAMGRGLSVVGALVYTTSPPVLGMLRQARDFSKTPFFLAAFLILGFLVARRRSPRVLLLLSAGLGLVTGVGMGFRQDLLIVLPAAAVVVASCARDGQGRRSLRIGAAAVALLAAGSLATGWPMLLRMEGGSNPYRPIMQGFSSRHRASAGVRSAAYEPLTCGDDNYVFATAYDYNQRVLGPSDSHIGIDSPEDARAERAWVLRALRTFPADAITRGYGSVLRTLGFGDVYGAPSYTAFSDVMGKIYRPVASWLHWLGPMLAAAVLLLIGARDFWQGGLIAFLLLYFCGATALECELRHAFHLCFIPFWFLGFMLHAGRLALRKCGRVAGLSVRRTGGLALLAAVVCGAPLGAARMYQHQTTGRLFARYAAADLEPLETQPEALANWVLFRQTSRPVDETMQDVRRPVSALLLAQALGPEPFSTALLHTGLLLWMTPEYPEGHTQTHYLAADFDAISQDRVVLLKYETDGPPAENDFSQPVWVKGTSTASGVIRYFFPVYQVVIKGGRNRFVGLAVPREQASAFRGLYAVRELDDFPLLLNVSLPADWTAAPRWETLNWDSDWSRYYRAETRGLDHMAAAKAAQGKTQRAILLYRAAIARRPRPYLEDRVRQLLVEQGDWPAAAEAYVRLIDLHPDDIGIYSTLDTLLREHLSPEYRAATWWDVAQAHPEAVDAWFFLGEALEATNDLEGALAAYRSAAACDPDGVFEEWYNVFLKRTREGR